MAAESKFEKQLISDLLDLYPGAIILKNDSSYLQGIPDRILLWRDRWAAFEVKATRTSVHQPNQDYYVNLMRSMSYASFVYPSNMEKVLHELQKSFRTGWTTRLPFRK